MTDKITQIQFIFCFPGDASGKEPACHCRGHKRSRFNPQVGKIPWRRAQKPAPVFLPGESHRQRSLEGYGPWVRKELDTTEATQHTHSTHTHTHTQTRSRTRIVYIVHAFFCSEDKIFADKSVNLFFFFSPSDVGSVEGLAYHRAWDTLYWTSSTTSSITRHTVDQTRPGAFDREAVIAMSEDDHPHVLALDECQK